MVISGDHSDGHVRPKGLKVRGESSVLLGKHSVHRTGVRGQILKTTER